MLNIHLSNHFTYSKLLKFVYPTILMMVLTSLYSVVDGLFVSIFINSTAFAATSFILPIYLFLGCIGFMFGTGGSALVAKLFGQKDYIKANKVFSFFVYFMLFLGLCLTFIGFNSLEFILNIFGVKGVLKNECLHYGGIVLLGTMPLVLEYFFHPFMVVAERPRLGLMITFCSGFINIFLDAIFIVVCGYGLEGAALATLISVACGGFLPLIYFYISHSQKLRIGKTKLYFKQLLKAASNGISEFVTNISVSIATMLYNYQMLRYVGEDGVAAFGVISCTDCIFLSMFIGYAMGTSPIISFNYGAQNTKELRNIFQKNCTILFCGAMILTIIAELLAGPITNLFIKNNPQLLHITQNGFMIYVISYLIAGFNINASALFTAFGNGLTSALISFMRSCVFDCIFVLLFPIFFGISGIWSATIASEFFALILSICCILIFHKKYQYY